MDFAYLTFKSVLVQFIPTLITLPLCYLFKYAYIISQKEKYSFISKLLLFINYILGFVFICLLCKYTTPLDFNDLFTALFISILIFIIIDYIYLSGLDFLINTFNTREVHLPSGTYDIQFIVRFVTNLFCFLIIIFTTHNKN